MSYTFRLCRFADYFKKARRLLIFESEFIQCWHIITLMEKAKFSSLESCLFNDKQYITDWVFISANLYCSFSTSKNFSATNFMVGGKLSPTRPTTKPQKLKKKIHIILTFSLQSDSCVQMLLLVWEPVCFRYIVSTFSIRYKT